MSKKTLYGLSSQKLQAEFNDTCFKLGLEIHKEEVAQRNQSKLRDYQTEVSEAFNAAVVREQEAAEKKAKADKATAEFEAKSASNTTTAQPAEETPTP